ncbi:MAG: NAD(P)H-dependent oxidoreductase, partial [Oxalobacter sp.]|nr:NAD(P)H-dependent oxidoreductase [Oxalobacter sp.]
MFRLAIIIGSTRPHRNGEAVAKWIFDIARQHRHTDAELVDIRDYHLPLLDEPQPASSGQYCHAYTRAWSEKIASFDGFVFVTPEYNHAPPAALKNALDY